MAPKKPGGLGLLLLVNVVILVSGFPSEGMLDFSEFEELIEEEMEDLAAANRTTHSPTTTGPVPVDGGWGDFAPWGECVGICESGTKMAWRSCNSPSPANGGAECVGLAANTTGCVLDAPCPDISMTLKVKLDCDDWTDYDMHDRFQRVFSRTLQSYVEEASISITTNPSCEEEDGVGRRRLGGGNRLKITVVFDLEPSEVESLMTDPNNLNGTVLGGMKALLSDWEEFESIAVEETADVSGGWINDVFEDTYEEIAEAFKDGDVLDSTAPKVTTLEPFEDEEYEYGNDGGSTNNLKGILFLSFVVGLTTFVVAVLFLVSYLERQKCLDREDYNSLSGGH